MSRYLLDTDMLTLIQFGHAAAVKKSHHWLREQCESAILSTVAFKTSQRSEGK
jgi:hypothetical protein